MLPYLKQDMPFPNLDTALSEPNCLLAAGGDLSTNRLLQAYSQGIFPWYSPGEPILWWSPNPRTVFFIEKFKVHKSVIKALKKNEISISLNKNFTEVIQQCAKSRRKNIEVSSLEKDSVGEDENDTWITEEIMQAYSNLHQQGKAHSVEVWQNNEIVGGIYGLSVNGVFCGESMFSRIANGSKIALSCLVKYLSQFQFKLVDGQVENPHLISLGAENIVREEYIKILNAKLTTMPEDLWQQKYLDWQALLQL